MSLDGFNVLLHDLPMLFFWWFWLFFTGLVFAPWCTVLFPDWPDRGYPFAKPLGLLICGYTSWLLASLDIIQFGSLSVFITLIAFGVITFSTAQARSDLIDLIWKRPRILWTRELGFMALFLFWAVVRGQNPDIHGLEKFMDFGFVNACLRSPTMPPPDPWFAGETINYYYFGHFIAAWLIKLIHATPDTGYNLSIASLFALSFTLSFSFVAALTQAALDPIRRLAWNLAGFVGALLATCGGNSHAFWKWFLPLVGVPFFAAKPFRYSDSTRFIGYDPPSDDKTIHEFPLYSFIVSDLHGHLSNLPFVILFIAVLFAGWRRSGGNFVAIPVWPYFPLFALSIAVFSMTNPWDVPIYLLLGGFIVLLSNSIQSPLNAGVHLEWREWGRAFATRVAVIVIGFPLLALPFAQSFVNFSKGIGFTFSHTPLGQLLTLWGGHLVFALVFICWFFWPGKQSFQPWKCVQNGSPTDRFCLAMIATSICLLIIPEIVYVKDIYSQTFYRANTMFKLTFQAFILLSLVGGFVFERIPRSISARKVAWGLRVLLSSCVVALLLFGIPAISQFYGGVLLHRYAGQEGLRFLDRSGSGDFLAVQWLQANVTGQPFILEAYGRSYSDFARISMATGLPTPMGWDIHQRLWRGDDLPCSVRSSHVACMYQSGRINMVQDLLKKYRIRYIIVGALERQQFPNLHQKLFQENFREVFSAGETKIYENKE